MQRVNIKQITRCMRNIFKMTFGYGLTYLTFYNPLSRQSINN